MKIFKNRGDFYLSKAKFKSSREERILVILMIFVVCITIATGVILNNKYDSVKEFFGDGEVSTTLAENEEEKNIPVIKGKLNCIVIETDEEESNIHYIYMLQVDKDNKAYKVCIFNPNMIIDNENLNDIYNNGGGAAIQTKLAGYLGIDIDYYTSFKKENFVKVINKFGKVSYDSKNEIKFNKELKEDNYIVRVGKGNNSLDGNDLTSLVRYFSNDSIDYQKANEVVLFGFTQLINEENFEDSEALFKLFINNTSTNISVRDYQENLDALFVFSKNNIKTKVYMVNSKYDNNNVLTHKSVGEIKSYFNK